MNLGRIIKKHRENLGMSQEDVALTIGTSISFISNIEKGGSNMPLVHLKKVCWLLEIHKDTAMRALLSQYRDKIKRSLYE